MIVIRRFDYLIDDYHSQNHLNDFFIIVKEIISKLKDRMISRIKNKV